MSTHMAHSALPWESEGIAGDIVIARVENESVVAIVPDGAKHAQANAAYIVRACNALPALVKELAYLVGALEADAEQRTRYAFSLSRAREALAQAGETR